MRSLITACLFVAAVACMAAYPFVQIDGGRILVTDGRIQFAAGGASTNNPIGNTLYWQDSQGNIDSSESMPYTNAGQYCVMWITANTNPTNITPYTVRDGSPAKNDAAQTNASARPVWLSGDTNGFGCLSFDGSSHHLRAAVSQFDTIGTNNVTMMLWLKTFSDSATTASIISKRSPTGALNQVQLRIGVSPGRYDWLTYSTVESRLYSDGASYNDGRWRHVAVVREGAILKIYVNGVNTDTSGALTIRDVSNAESLLIGARSPDGGSPCRMVADNVCVFTAAVPSNIIYSIYSAGTTNHPY